MDPPRQSLEWSDVLNMASVANFDLLKDMDLDLEIVRLNVEIRRLLTFMIDDYADFYHAAARAHNGARLDVAAELKHRMEVLSEINGHIAIRLVQTSTLVPGHRKGQDPSITDSAPLPPWASVVLGLTRHDESYEVRGSSRDLPEILSNKVETTTYGPDILDYFEGLSIANRVADDL
ncbi:hypothetical protein PQX77_021162 [Marasmius sp. AFHP31]|nr:hypothetical protein PQX77_021162 [Marasmius sp. AFHP31]